MEKKTIKIEISNITNKQIKAMEYLFSKWQYDGQIGHSEWTAFFADGDGDFQPHIKIDGKGIDIAEDNTSENDKFVKKIDIHKVDIQNNEYIYKDYMPMYDEDYFKD